MATPLNNVVADPTLGLLYGLAYVLGVVILWVSFYWWLHRSPPQQPLDTTNQPAVPLSTATPTDRKRGPA